MGREHFGFKRWFVIAWAVAAISVIVLLIATHGRTWRINSNARMTEFSVCSGLDSSGAPLQVTYPITVRAKKINVCGYLEGNEPIRLRFVWKYNGEVLADLVDYYQPGYVTTHLIASPTGFKAGKYLVLTYSGRRNLASTEFTIEQR